MTDKQENESESITGLIRYGADIAGSSVGAAIGALAGGTPGAIVGALGGTALKHALCSIGTEISKRFLGNREKVRIGATYAFAIRKIEENIENGKQLRQGAFP